MFQRYVKSRDDSEIMLLSLHELRAAHQQLGSRDTEGGYRLALLARIEEIENEKSRVRESHVRGWNYIVMLVIAVLAGLVVYFLTRSPS